MYIDESYGDDQTFLIQTAIGVPPGNAELAFNQILQDKFAAEPNFAREEFKAGRIAANNSHVYQWFLQQVINVLAEISDRTPISTIIAVDSAANYRTDIYDRLYAMLRGSFDDIGYPPTEIDVAREFIRQVIWLHARLTQMFPASGTGDIEIYFDNKFRLAQSFDERVTIWVPKGAGRRIRMTEERWKTYTRLFRILLQALPTTRTFPTVSKFTYIDSKASHLVQAADVLSNLTLNAIRHRMGITNDLIKLKYDMLCSVLDADPIHPELLTSLIVSGPNISCPDTNLFSRITLTS
jgi:hypothetical protein